MKCLKRIISIILVIAIAVPVFAVSASAASTSSAQIPSGADLITDLSSVQSWALWMDANVSDALGNAASVLIWDSIDGSFARAGVGFCSSHMVLNNAATVWNSYYNSLFNLAIKQLTGVFTGNLGGFMLSASVQYDSTLGVYRLRDNVTNLWLVNSSGHFPYYAPETPDQEVTYEYQWLRTTEINWNGGIAIVSYTELKEILALGYDGYIERRGNYLHIFDRASDGTKVLCSEEGFPLSAISDMSNTAVGTPNNYYTEEGDTVNNYDQGDTIYNEFLDITNNTTWFPNGTLQYIDKVVYDESTKTYIVDSHDSYTYNSTTNNYVTNNYRYEYNFHIDYTSVTYIGTTEQYDEEYRYYYQLPDGRSSADLTAEDLEQLSIAFVDVVNYARSADDANMRVLYHFDGNTQDSSYWSYCTDFTWNTGASLTYMDEGTFGGSLYLDETEHDFTITLPNSSDGSGDFTLQFRYYQSYTAAPVTDSFIKLGDNHVLWFSGSEYSIGSFGGTTIAQTSVGTWNEIALICSGGTLYYYFNGVPYATSADGYFTGGTITFHFGSEQQTYKKLDELRFSRGAIYTPGENYEPTAVPHDTNLTLILPDGERPMADEIMVITPSQSNLLDSVGLSDWSSQSVLNNLYSSPDIYSVIDNQFLHSYTYPIVYDSDVLQFSPGSGYVHVDFGGSIPTASNSMNCTYPVNSFAIPIMSFQYGGIVAPSFGFEYNKTYTLSVVLADGSYSHITFYLRSPNNIPVQPSEFYYSSVIASSISFKLTNLGGYRSESSIGTLQRGFVLYSSTGESVDIAYMELVEGSEPQFEISYEMAMYSSGELEDSPVLAVRSNQTITGYQIGGVRPSYPEKGQVWAMVENGRITSLQQYTGSAWVEVDGRIWTGQRWIPYSSFDVFLLKDCYDIQGTVTGDDYEYIYSESGFWAWFQKQWLAFMAKIDQILDAVQKISGTGGSDLEDEQTFPDAADPDGDGSSWGIVDLLVSVKDGVWHFVTGVVSAGFDGFTEFTVSIVRIGDLFDSFDEDNENGIFIPVEEGGSVWD